MATAKPVAAPWALTGTRTAPLAGKVNTGYVFEDPVPFDELNYQMGIAGDWQKFLDERFAGTSAGELKIIAEIQSNNGTTDPAIRARSGTGAGARAFSARSADTSSVAITAATSNVTDVDIVSRITGFYPGCAIYARTDNSGLPAIVGENLNGAGGGSGVQGVSTSGPGVTGLGLRGLLGQGTTGAGAVGVGNNQTVSTAITAGGAAGVVGYSNSKAGIYGLGNDVPGLMAEVDSTTPQRGALNLVGQTDPAAPAAGDVWYFSTDNALFHYDGTSKRRLTDFRYFTTASSSAIASTTGPTTFSNGSFTIPASCLWAGAVIEVEALISWQLNANGEWFILRLNRGSGGSQYATSGQVTAAAAASGTYRVQWRIVVESINASTGVVNFAGSAVWGFTTGSFTAATDTLRATSARTTSQNTTTALALVLQIYFNSSNANNNATLADLKVRVY